MTKEKIIAVAGTVLGVLILFAIFGFLVKIAIFGFYAALVVVAIGAVAWVIYKLFFAQNRL